MNNQTRKVLRPLIGKLEQFNADLEAYKAEVEAKAQEFKERLEGIKVEAETAADEEQEKFDNMPEGLQQGESGQRIEEIAGQLREAVEALESADSELDDLAGGAFENLPDYLESAKDGIENAIQE